mmetsp:Transcript_4945/g.14880  ORF Transcript_4945/g.14880 Transcript_4945/m.14880 type:complete len:712 (+) Transcript_4945:88-2223(+)
MGEEKDNYGSLLEVYRRRLLDGFLRKVKAACNGPYFVLVVDREALRHLGLVLDNKELAKEGVTLMEILDRNREPLPSLHAAYLLSSTTESVEMFATESVTQYAAFHVCFLSALSNRLLETIRSRRDLKKKVKTLCELGIDFLVPERSTFSLGNPGGGIPHLWGASSMYFQEEVKDISIRLTNACSLMVAPSNWTVRYPVAAKAASSVAQELHKMLGAKSSAGGQATDSGFTSGTVLVLDRMADPITPLVHEFTFQAMIHDVLQLDTSKPGGSRYNPQRKDDAANAAADLVLEDESFESWVKFKHQHVADVSQKQNAELKSFIDGNPAAKIHMQGAQAGEEITVKEMSEAVRALPEYSEKLSRHAALFAALNDCMDAYKKQNLDDLARVEQDLVTGKTSTGEKCKSKRVLQSVGEILIREGISAQNKSRLVALAYAVAHSNKYMCFLGGRPTYLSGLSFPSRYDVDDALLVGRLLTPDLKAPIDGLKRVLGEVETMGKDHRNFLRNSEYKQIKKELQSKPIRSASERFDVSRYLPHLQVLASDMVEDCLPHSVFPAMRVTNRAILKTNRLFMVFVIGGISYSETRVVSELNEQLRKFGASMICGGSVLLTPTMFMESLASVVNESIKAKVIRPPPPLLFDKVRPAQKASKGVSTLGEVDEITLNDLDGSSPNRANERSKQQGGRSGRFTGDKSPSAANEQGGRFGWRLHRRG